MDGGHPIIASRATAQNRLLSLVVCVVVEGFHDDLPMATMLDQRLIVSPGCAKTDATLTIATAPVRSIYIMSSVRSVPMGSLVSGLIAAMTASQGMNSVAFEVATFEVVQRHPPHHLHFVFSLHIPSSLCSAKTHRCVQGQ